MPLSFLPTADEILARPRMKKRSIIGGVQYRSFAIGLYLFGSMVLGCAHTEGGESSPRCAPPEGASHRPATSLALEIAADARPEAWVPLAIALQEPGFDHARLAAGDPDAIRERKEQLDPIQKEIEARLSSIGAVETSRLWLTNTVTAQVPAERVPEILCWPGVIEFEVMAPYWSVVDRPWDVESVGELACPVVDGACPKHCREVRGVPYDPKARCREGEEELVACSIETESGGRLGCARDQANRAFLFQETTPIAPGYAGWDGCGRRLFAEDGIGASCPNPVEVCGTEQRAICPNVPPGAGSVRLGLDTDSTGLTKAWVEVVSGFTQNLRVSFGALEPFYESEPLRARFDLPNHFANDGEFQPALLEISRCSEVVAEVAIVVRVDTYQVAQGGFAFAGSFESTDPSFDVEGEFTLDRWCTWETSF